MSVHLQPMKPAMAKWIPAGIGLLAFLLYLGTGARTIQWQDSAQFTYRITTGTWANEYGLAMVHPLHFYLGRLFAGLFPDQLPWAISGVSAVGGGVAVGLVSWVLLRHTRSVSTSLYGAGVLMLAHTFWRFSAIPEVYTLSAALLMGEIAWFLQAPERPSGRWWGILFLINGLALANHNLALLSLPVWGMCWILSCRRGENAWSSLVWIAGGWTLGAFLFLSMIATAWLQGGALSDVLSSALFGEDFLEEVTGILPDPQYLLISAGFLLVSFPLVPFGLSVQGAKTHLQKGMPLVYLGGIHLLFFSRYNVIDQYTFFIPVMVILALLAGFGFSTLSASMRRLCVGILLLQPLGYAVLPSVVESSGLMASLERNKPYRDDYRYLFWPWMFAETSASELAEDVLTASEQGITPVTVEDRMAYYTMKWALEDRGVDVPVYVNASSFDAEATGIWVPARSGALPPDGWKRHGEVWIPDSSSLDTPSTAE